MEQQPSEPQSPSERLAPVTYLFGRAPEAAVPPVADPTPPVAEAPPAQPAGRVPAQPVYRDLPAINPTPLVEPVETATADNPALTHPTHSARPENVSMHALTRRGMSVAEMTKLLEAREIEPDEVEAELERLQGVGLLDDQALADNLVRTLQDRKGLGRSAISAELRRRKVDQAAIEEALDSIDTDDELVRAIEVATKRAGQLRSYDPETAKRRLFAYLQRRGYGGSVLKAAMTAALEPQHNSQRHSADSRSGSETGGPRFR